MAGFAQPQNRSTIERPAFGLGSTPSDSPTHQILKYGRIRQGAARREDQFAAVRLAQDTVPRRRAGASAAACRLVDLFHEVERLIGRHDLPNGSICSPTHLAMPSRESQTLPPVRARTEDATDVDVGILGAVCLAVVGQQGCEQQYTTCVTTHPPRPVGERAGAPTGSFTARHRRLLESTEDRRRRPTPSILPSVWQLTAARDAMSMQR